MPEPLPRQVRFPGGGRRTAHPHYDKFAEQTGRLAHLFERHDIQQENRVALLLLDKIEYPIIFWGCLKAGVIPVALNTLLATDVYGLSSATAGPARCSSRTNCCRPWRPC